MKVCVCLCYLNMREVAITAPRSKRQRRIQENRAIHSPAWVLKTEVRTSQRYLRARPSRRRREGLVGAPTAKGWESQRTSGDGQPTPLEVGPWSCPRAPASSRPGPSHTHTRHSNGTQRHTKTHVHTPWQCTKSRYYLNCWATGNCNYVILLQFPHKVNFLTRAMLQKKLSLKRKEKLWRICSILNFHHLWHEIYIQGKMMKTQRLISLCSQGSFSLSAHRFTLQTINQCDSMSHKQSLKMCAIRFV